MSCPCAGIATQAGVVAGVGSLPAAPAPDVVAARRLAGMGLERVARLFTPVYQSGVVADDRQTLWVQVDLGAERRLDAVKLLPMVVWWSGESQGFPVRFRIEVSSDPGFGTSHLIADCAQQDEPDPQDLVRTFPAGGLSGRYVRLTASHLRQRQLALTKMIVMAGGLDVAQGGRVSDSRSGDLGAQALTRPPRPQGEYVVTDNPGNLIPPEQWQPVAYQAQAPLGGVRLAAGLFKEVLENNCRYLLSAVSVDEMARHFLLRAGRPAAPLAEARSRQWFDTLPGSEAGRFLMGAGNTLRWLDNAELQARMDQVVGVVAACAEPDGYLMGYPRERTFVGENGAYVRSWVTQGLIEAGYAGNTQAFGLLRRHYDGFNQSCYLPELLRRSGQGTQGIIPSTRLYFTPVGKAEDLLVVQRYFQENYWLEQLARRDPAAIWLYPYDRPHNYLITALEPYLDLYRATGARQYLDAVLGGWELYREHWQHVGGAIAISEGTDLYPPGSYALRRGTGELCGSVFWVRLNQRLHLLYPEQERYVTEIEKSIYNAAIANQVGDRGIRYHARLVDHKDLDRNPYYHCMNTCCEGQGTRLLGSLPEYIYALADDGLYVDLFAASEITVCLAGRSFGLAMSTQFPYEPDVRLQVRVAEPVRASLRIRVPSWATSDMPVSLNGCEAAVGRPGSYVRLERTWRPGDEVTFALPIGFRATCYQGTEPGFNDGCHYALEYGPLLLALRRQDGGSDGLALSVAAAELPQVLRALPGRPLHFAVPGDEGVEYVPYFAVQDEPCTCFPRLGRQEMP